MASVRTVRSPRRSPVPLLAGVALLAAVAAISPGTASAAVPAAVDTAAPVLVYQTHNGNVVNLANGSKEVVVTALVTDATGARTPTAGFRAVNGADTAGFGPMVLVSGTPKNGKYERRITVPSTTPKTWFVVVDPLEDTLGNTETASHQDSTTMTVYNSSVPSVPTAPPGVWIAAVGDGMVAIRCNGAPFNGGSPVTSFRITASPGGQTMTASTCSWLFKGLTNGVTYTFTIAATNSRGTSEESQPSAPATPKFALSRTPAPVISGAVEVGSTLTATPGSWQPAPVTLTYRWYRVSSSGMASPLNGAVRPKYVITSADRGFKLSVTVTGSKDGYPSVARGSEATTPVPGILFATPTPVVTGARKVGSTLTANPGTWEPAPVTLAYRWYRVASTGRSSAIPWATRATYATVAKDAGYRLKVVVTGSKPDYPSVSRTSVTTGAIAR